MVGHEPSDLEEHPPEALEEPIGEIESEYYQVADVMEKTPVSGPPTSVLPQCPTPSTYASTAPFPLPLPFPTHLCLFFHAGLLTRRATGRPRPPSPSMWRAL